MIEPRSQHIGLLGVNTKRGKPLRVNTYSWLELAPNHGDNFN